MERNFIGITSATIYGLEKKVYFCDHRCYWAWNISFKDHSFIVDNLERIYMGKSKDEAQKTRRDIKKVFDKCHIHDGDRVAILYDANGVVALGKGKEERCWIDVRDKFKLKTSKELNISPDSLIIARNH